MTEKRSRGRPRKVNPNDPASVAKRIQEQIDKFDAKCVDKLDELLNVMFNIATQEKINGANVGIKDKAAAAKWCVERIEEKLKDLEEIEEEEPEVLDEEPVPLISYASK